MLSNRHFNEPIKKRAEKPAPTPSADKGINKFAVSAVIVDRMEVILALVDWQSVSGASAVAATLKLVGHLFQGKKLVLVSKDPFKYGTPTVFFGQPEIAAKFEGHQANEFKWTPVEYKLTG